MTKTAENTEVQLNTDPLPVSEVVAPTEPEQLAEAVAAAAAAGQAVYPIGGGTSLDYGMPPTREGLGLSLSALKRTIDYPFRDLTITVEPGLSMAELAEALKRKGQFLPIDVPQPETATIGGVVAANFNGPRRYGQGTIRDYVIGIEGVDGRGAHFKAGGQVVKNVAGYDLCKLLTGSLGTLAVITQLTLRLKPLPEATALLVLDLPELKAAEPVLAGLIHSETTPTAIELLGGPVWMSDEALGRATSDTGCRIVVGLEGTKVEVDWMLAQLRGEWSEAGHSHARQVEPADASALWSRLAGFPAAGEDDLVIKASTVPSNVVPFLCAVQEAYPDSSAQAHAGDGVILVRFPEFDPGDVSKVLVGKLQGMVAATGVPGANVNVLSTRIDAGWTRRAIWGASGPDAAIMQAVKQQMDPSGILNPGRFIYPSL